MEWKVVEISSEETSRAWNHLKGSDVQKILHNYLVTRIDEMRLALETSEMENVTRLQAGILAHRNLLNVVHSYDTPNLKEQYACRIPNQ